MAYVLLIISVCFVGISSFLLSVSAESKKFLTAFCYFIGIIFAQTVLSFEILSLFKGISIFNYLVANFIFVIAALLVFYKKRPEITILKDFQDEVRKIKSVISHDKMLKVIGIAFCLFLIGTFIFMIFMPVYDEDAFSYHLVRVPFWIDNGSINHFLIADIRALIMPINSEIFYSWAYLFIKSDIFVRFFSFGSYLLFVAGLYGIFEELKIARKKRIQSILTITAMHNVMLSISGTETNITIAGLMIAAVYLFMNAVKGHRILPIFFASLLYALAIGTKTPAIQASLSLLLIASVIAYVYLKKDFYKPLLICAGFLFVNFIIFASYNYVLNYIDFGNPLTSKYAQAEHAFAGGFKGFIANNIRYLFSFFDFSGMPFSVVIWRLTSGICGLVIALLNIQPDIGCISSNDSLFVLGNDFENTDGLGVFGFLIFLPAVYIAFQRLKTSQSPRTIILSLFAAGFIINMLVLSVTLGYMIFSIRFIMFFVLFASPVFVYGYIRNKKSKMRLVITILTVYFFTFSYYFYERRFSPYLSYIFVKNKCNYSAFKEQISCANIDFTDPSQSCRVVRKIKEDKNPKKVLFFTSSATNIYYMKHHEDENFQTEFRLLENTDENDIDPEKYDYVVFAVKQVSSNILSPNGVSGKYKSVMLPEGKVGLVFEKNNFSQCIYQHRKDLKTEFRNPYTRIICTYNPAIVRSKGFEQIDSIPNYDKTQMQNLVIYRRIKK